MCLIHFHFILDDNNLYVNVEVKLKLLKTCKLFNLNISYCWCWCFWEKMFLLLYYLTCFNVVVGVNRAMTWPTEKRTLLYPHMILMSLSLSIAWIIIYPTDKLTELFQTQFQIDWHEHANLNESLLSYRLT